MHSGILPELQSDGGLGFGEITRIREFLPKLSSALLLTPQQQQHLYVVLAREREGIDDFGVPREGDENRERGEIGGVSLGSSNRTKIEMGLQGLE